ncbi:hypothetical protein EW146_g6822 [Bondarzewia mesenterica]|uniref:Mediator of RNA polymerase II transcription subunit 14 n=1 Tax=Bondarzewia mesenterica TaxID=1095465 RepID=A0A4S4LN51_9AGAM|nr:hypothetical protein EW146_g6822 [Bondarzewia mesenterica]
MALNGANLTASTSRQPQILSGFVDGILPYTNGFDEPPIELLEQRLPVVYDGQVPLAEVVSRVAQACYAELTEMAETLPHMSDPARKRKLADFVVAWKKQVVKLYAVAKWSRDADVVQKCMNITAFLMNQNRQFEDVIKGLKYAKDSLDPARLRNHDLLTSLDVLTTGSYRRLPTGIKKAVVPPTPLTDDQVTKTLRDIEALIRYRLRMQEIIPIEMSKYRISDGRVFFHVPKLFEASLSLRGGNKHDGWFFAHVEFLFNVGGDRTGMQEFPRKPSGVLKRHITDEADARLAYYLPLPPDQPSPPPGIELPPIPKLPDGTVDAPLVRIFNFLQMMSMSYQLEILWYQASGAQRMRSLGWADYLTVEMSKDRKTLTVSYWIRKPLPRPVPSIHHKPPLLGGSLTISLVSSPSPRRSPKSRVLAELQEKSKLSGTAKWPSDEVEGVQWHVKWKPAPGALGVNVMPEDVFLPDGEVTIDADDVDFERLLRQIIERHTRAIFRVLFVQLQQGPVFSAPESVAIIMNDGHVALRAHLCADEQVIVTIEPRTGRLNLRDTGDLGAAGRGPRFSAISDKLNENTSMLLEALIRLRMNTIIELAEQKATYLGLQTFRQRNFAREEFQKLGPAARGLLYIQLSPFPTHYLVLVVTDDDFRYALISVKTLEDRMFKSMVMEDIGWLNIERICAQGREAELDGEKEIDVMKRKKEAGPLDGQGKMSSKFKLETHVLRELYAYCCARVAHIKVERQFKARNIPYEHVYPASPALGSSLPSSLSHLHSALSHKIPALCVKSSDILSGSPAFEAAMPNIRVIPLSWWTASAPGSGERPPQVVTCVKLKYVQPPVGRRAVAGKGVIRLSKGIVYDANEAVVCFLSDEVEGCVDEFLQEWASVSKIVVIAREVAEMAKEKRWQDVRILSFDLQTVEFAYASNYTVSITCTDQLTTEGSYNLHFSRHLPSPLDPRSSFQRGFNLHSEASIFFRTILGQGKLSSALPVLVSVLRNTVPVIEVLEEIDERKEGLEDIEVKSFAKAAGWWRVLFYLRVGAGRHSHGLDFRLMKGGRVAILDAAQSLYFPTMASHVPPALADDTFILKPIPKFPQLLESVARELRGVRIAVVDIGIVCGVAHAHAVGRKVWECIERDVIGKNAGKG